jgi:hypothetical protein
MGAVVVVFYSLIYLYVYFNAFIFDIRKKINKCHTIY